MACRKRSNVGYSVVVNNAAQTLTTNSAINLGSVVAQSAGENVTSMLAGQSLLVNNCGTYYISVQVIPEAATTASIALFVNGVQRATTTTATGTQYEVRGIFNLCAGDIITVKSVGADTVTLAANTLAGGYNVNTVIERYN